jgi:hypothetical protein
MAARRPKPEKGATDMANTSLPVPVVKKALESMFVRTVYGQMALAVNLSLIRRPGEAYEPLAVQPASSEVN